MDIFRATKRILKKHNIELEVNFISDQEVFLKHNKSFRWHLGDYEKHIFFPFEGL